MDIPFWKMHGASNDFILVDDRGETFPAEDHAWIAEISSRHRGVGSEGVILIQPSETADFRMRFFNPDGSEVEMCGNGARCVARLASELGVAGATMSFDTVAGVVRATCRGELIELQMTEPTSWRLNQSIDLEGQETNVHVVNTGVPHVVIEVDDVDSVDIQRVGSLVRYHECFAPAGTNANFVQPRGSDSLRIRTYERGVEAETPACGTGIVAGALIMGKLGHVTSPARVIPASGDALEVGFTLTENGATSVTLLGPAVHVFRGILQYGGEK